MSSQESRALPLLPEWHGGWHGLSHITKYSFASSAILLNSPDHSSLRQALGSHTVPWERTRGVKGGTKEKKMPRISHKNEIRITHGPCAQPMTRCWPFSWKYIFKNFSIVDADLLKNPEELHPSPLHREGEGEGEGLGGGGGDGDGRGQRAGSKTIPRVGLLWFV